jgi:hypothetical protein
MMGRRKGEQGQLFYAWGVFDVVRKFAPAGPHRLGPALGLPLHCGLSQVRCHGTFASLALCRAQAV